LISITINGVFANNLCTCLLRSSKRQKRYLATLQYTEKSADFDSDYEFEVFIQA